MALQSCKASNSHFFVLLLQHIEVKYRWKNNPEVMLMLYDSCVAFQGCYSGFFFFVHRHCFVVLAAHKQQGCCDASCHFSLPSALQHSWVYSCKDFKNRMFFSSYFASFHVLFCIVTYKQGTFFSIPSSLLGDSSVSVTINLELASILFLIFKLINKTASLNYF